MPPLNIESEAKLSADNLFGSTTDQDLSETGAAASGVRSGNSGDGTDAFRQAKAALPTQLDVSQPKEVLLKQLDVSETPRMPPVAGAGVGLARLVLYIAAGSILILTVYLISMEFSVARDVRDAYAQVLSPNRIGAEFYTLSRLEQLSVDLSTARENSEWQMSADSRQNADSILKMIATLPSIASADKTQLGECIPLPPANASRSDKLDRCIGIVRKIQQPALEAAVGATNAQLAGESASKINEHRQSLHNFWIQAAQLILLNLLLPLLTALFGYVFGTQQAQRAN